MTLRYWKVRWVEDYGSVPKGWEPFAKVGPYRALLVRRKVWFWQ